jgi:response regulator RpfG family c-di-GMP phosphodiesterase
MKEDEKILLVDDEPLVLAALHRALCTEFHVEMAVGPDEAMQKLENQGPFAVVVSDFKMPTMNGVQFLAYAGKCYPETVRIMLTGQADLNAAMAAVNEGQVFRFLSKPCPATILARTLEAALDQYRLITAERELLRHTLMGSITMLAEILSAVAPAAFSCSFRIKRYVMLLAKAVGLQDAWQLEVAGILSQIGCIAVLPPDAIHARSMDLLEDNPHLFSRQPLAAANFLRKIPRLETTAEIVALQHKPYREYDPDSEDDSRNLVELGGQILHVAVELERLIRRGSDFRGAIKEMRCWKGEYNPYLLDSLDAAGEPSSGWVPASVTIVDLDTSMVADEDIRALNGQVLVPKGEQLTDPLLERLRSFVAAVGIVEPIKVVLPQEVAFHDHLNQDVCQSGSLWAKSDGPGLSAPLVLEPR